MRCSRKREKSQERAKEEEVGGVVEGIRTETQKRRDKNIRNFGM